MMRSCLASERTISQFLSPTLSMPFHLYYSGHMAKDTSSCPEPSASPNGLWVNGRYRAFTSHQSARGRHFLTSMKAINTQLEILWLSSSSLERLGVDLHHRQDPIWTQDLSEQSSDKWNPLWWHFFFPHQVLLLHFLTEFSASTFSQPNKASKHALAQSPLCFPPTPERPQGTSSSSTALGLLSHRSPSAAILK